MLEGTNEISVVGSWQRKFANSVRLHERFFNDLLRYLALLDHKRWLCPIPTYRTVRYIM